MPSPRALLRSKFVAWFTIAELDRFVADHFDAARGLIPDRGTEDRADALIAWLQRENRIAEVWPALREERDDRTAEIDAIEAAWKLAPVADDAITSWLLKYQATLDKLFSDKLRGNPTWSASLDPLDLLVRERPAEGDPAPYVGRLDRVFGDVKPRSVLVADGGSGKSTIVLELGVRMARVALEQPTAPIPIFMQLNHFDSRERAFDGMLDGLAASSGLDPKALRDLWASDRPCCFLLDGLNEVRPEYRDSCRSAIGLLTQRTHRCIVTSRPSPDVDKLVSTVGASVLEIVPLTKQQVRKVLEQHSIAAVDLDRIAELAETPFLVSAIIRIFQGDRQRKLPTTVPQLYRTLIDEFVFAKREEEAPSDVRPTTYDYEHVKRPILADLALRMRRDGLTRVPENADLRTSVKTQLFALRDKYEGELEVMPEKPIAQNLVDELVTNGVLSRDAETLEFWHESVLDYFTALALDALSPDEVAALVPPLVWRHTDPSTNFDRVPFAFAESLVMHAGFSRGAESLIAMANRHPAVAARCIGRAGIAAPSTLVDQWVAWLDHPHETRRWMGAECLRFANAVDDRIGRKLVELLVPETKLVEAVVGAIAACSAPGPVDALVDKLVLDDGELGLVSELYRHQAPSVVVSLVRRIASTNTPEESRNEARTIVGRIERKYVEDVIRQTGDDSLVKIVETLRWRPRALPKRYVRALDETRLRDYALANGPRVTAHSNDELVAMLDSAAVEDRFLALDVLDERRALAPHVSRLFEIVLTDRDDNVEIRAARCFERIPPVYWRDAWIRCATDPATYAGAWFFVIRMARHLGDDALATLDVVLATVPTARGEVAYVLGAIDSDRSLAKLASMIDPRNPDDDVLGGLSIAKNPRARELLDGLMRQAIDEQSPRLGRLASTMMTAGGASELHRHITATFEGPAAKRNVAALLFKSVPLWEREFLDITLRFARSDDPVFRRLGLSELLVTESTPETRDVLLRACVSETDNEAWDGASGAFRWTCTDEDVGNLRERRRDPDAATRARVIGTIARLNDYDLISDLREAAEDPDPAVRAAAIEGIRALDLTYPLAPEATDPT